MAWKEDCAMAKPVIVTINHDLGRQAAVDRIRGGFAQLTGTLGAAASINQRWEGDTMHFDAKALGQVATGRLDVFDKEVRIELQLSGLLGTMAGAIASRMKQKGTLLLEKK
jgi:hypothetical protein